MTVTTVKIESLLTNLRKSQLTGISFDPESLALTLEFTLGDEVKVIKMQFFQLIHLVISKEIDENDGCFFVGDVSLTPVADGGKEILSSLLYRFRERDGTVATYPQQSLFHFHLEGGVCIEAVCGEWELLS
ncbi:MAG: hypothetical protein Fur0025_24110 [Oscillatoriaceae cyanobacterium]